MWLAEDVGYLDRYFHYRGTQCRLVARTVVLADLYSDPSIDVKLIQFYASGWDLCLLSLLASAGMLCPVHGCCVWAPQKTSPKTQVRCFLKQEKSLTWIEHW